MVDQSGCVLCVYSVRLWNFRAFNTSDIEGPWYYWVDHQVSIQLLIRMTVMQPVMDAVAFY